MWNLLINCLWAYVVGSIVYWGIGSLLKIFKPREKEENLKLIYEKKLSKFENWSNLSFENRSNLSFENQWNSSFENRSNLSFENRWNSSFENRSNLSFENRSNLSFENRSNLSFESRSNLSSENRSNLSFEYSKDGLFRIYEITNQDDCIKACALLKSELKKLNALGFDCEWLNHYKRYPIALLQLASPKGSCCLFRLNRLRCIPNTLKEILSDVNILKVGVNSMTDAKYLYEDYDIRVLGVLDLRHIYPNAGGLAFMALSKVKIELKKNLSITCSDWGEYELTYDQKDYAARDAFAGIEIFKKYICENGYSVNDSSSQYSSLTLPASICCVLDTNFKTKPALLKKKEFTISESANYINQKKSESVKIARKSPLYHNCFMHAPDGELLCSCDKRKALWYVEKDLAEVILSEPYSIRLLFEPAARAGETSGGRYYQQLKQNCCVVCGASKSYLKHYVVPKEYRKYFPIDMKEHQSHDIVLTCIKCHHLATKHNYILRQKLAVLCDAPITGSKVTQSRSKKNIKNCAKALLTSGDVIPLERKNILENKIKQYYKVDYLTPDLLKEASNLCIQKTKVNYESHGIKVVNHFKSKVDGIIKLEKLWREHFVKTMDPKYLPALWSVTHNHSRMLKQLKGKAEK